jgi:hypothetical protein
MNRFLTNFLSKTLLLGMPFDKAVFLSLAAAVFSEVGMSSVPHQNWLAVRFFRSSGP